MAVVPVPRTWAVGDTVTNTMMNTEVRDAALYFLDQQAQMQYLSYVPTIINDTPATGTATWFTVGNLVVPSWATRARVQTNVTGAFTTEVGIVVTFAVKIGATSPVLSGRRILDPGTVSSRFTIAQADAYSGLTAGTQAVTVAVTFVAGTGVYRLDSLSYETLSATFLP